jgi:hypothetical protein
MILFLISTRWYYARTFIELEISGKRYCGSTEVGSADDNCTRQFSRLEKMSLSSYTAMGTSNENVKG